MADFDQTDNPGSWSIDRVVHEFCYRATPIWARSSLKSVRDIEGLESLLRDNDIDGETLLSLTKNDIQNDLHITSLGKRRRFITIVIYLCQCAGISPDPSLQPSAFTVSPDSSLRRSIVSASPLVGFRSQAAPIPQTNSIHPLHLSSVNQGQTRSPDIYHSIESDQVQKTDIELLDDLESHLNNELVSQDTRLTETPKRRLAGVEEHMQVGSVSTKRRRLAPEKLITLPPSSATTNEAAFAGDDANKGRTPTTSASRETIPKPTFTNINAQILTGPEASTLQDAGINVSTAPRAALQPHQVAQILRRKLDDSISSALDARDVLSVPQKFSSVNAGTDPATTRLKNRHMKNFMLGAVRAMPHSDKRVIVPRYQPRRARDQRILVIQPDGPPKVQMIRGEETDEILMADSNELPSNDAVEGLDGLGGDYLNLLANHPIADDDDDVLPLYGDSDEEDRYVTEGSISEDDPPTRVAQTDNRGQLTAAEVDAVIQDCIQLYVDEFKSRKLPKVQRAARRKWMYAARISGLRVSMIKGSQKILDLANMRLPKIIGAIHDTKWTSTSDVRQQCDALSATVDLIEEYKHYILVLSSDHEPILLSRQLAPRSRIEARVTDAGQEEDNCSSDDGSLSDFIEESSVDQFNLNGESGSSVIGTQSDPVHNSTVSVLPPPAVNSNQIIDLQNDSDTDMHDMFSDQQHRQDVVILNKQLEPALEPAPPITPQRLHNFVDNIADADDESDDVISSVRKSSAKKKALRDSKKRNPIKLPISFDSSEEVSDVEYSPTAVPRQRHSSQAHANTIDLTLSSPTRPASNTDFDIRTPELNPIDSDEHASPGMLNTNLPRLYLTMPQLPDMRHVRTTPWSSINTGHTRHQTLVLAKILSELDLATARTLLAYMRTCGGAAGLEEVMKTVFMADGDSEHLEASFAKRDHKVAELVTKLYLAWHQIEDIASFDELSEDVLDAAFTALDEDYAARFHDLSLRLLEHLVKETKPAGAPKTRGDWSPSDDLETETESTTGTDLEITESAPAARRMSRSDVQLDAHRRMREQLRLKDELTHRLGAQNNEDGDLVAVNFKEPIVYLDQSIANKIKPHQVEGLQFMWREIVEDPKKQGCLLAHTMGLGKTMQVISLLATVAQCNASSDSTMASHIPENLRKLRILVICPPTLIDNWFNEFLLWLPKHNTLGTLVKLRKPNEYNVIRQWSEAGGVLITGYQRLATYCKHIASDDALEIDSNTRDIKREMAVWLLASPSLVVADEAHVLKSTASQTNRIAAMIKTQSRIALTGSPLSNHLEEYWAMIDFVAPSYLGQQAAFKNKFVTPINNGLNQDSSSYQQRTSLKKLRVLKLIVQPKVNRADISALYKDLPLKTEFFITVPLTTIQKEIYTIFVRHFRSVVAAQKGTGGRGGILTWVSALSILLNHPNCLMNKLEAEVEENRGNAAAAITTLHSTTSSTGPDDPFREGLAEDVNIAEDSVIHNLIQQTIQVFDSHGITHDEKSTQLSYRALLTQQIIIEAVKRGEKTLLFSHSIPTLDYLGNMLDEMNCKYDRLDGSFATDKRQQAATNFNTRTGINSAQVFLISTRAGGLGLNLQGATRVIIYDYAWNPTWEEQAIGRAYRFGQRKPVFVYRMRVAGTYEDITFNAAVFKTQLFSRVVDHKTLLRKGTAKTVATTYLRDPTEPKQKDLTECQGKDDVLDSVLSQNQIDCVRSIDLTETFAQDIEEVLTAEEEVEVNTELALEKLRFSNPEAVARQEQLRLCQNQVAAARAAATATSPALVRELTAIQNACSQATAAFRPIPGSFPIERYRQVTGRRAGLDLEHPSTVVRRLDQGPTISHNRRGSLPSPANLNQNGARTNGQDGKDGGDNAPGCATQ